MRCDPGGDTRWGWAEILAMSGGAILLITLFLPLVRDWGPPGMHWVSTAGIVLDRLRSAVEAVESADVLRGLVAVSLLFAPHALGAIVIGEAAVARFRRGVPARPFRVGIRCCLSLWLAGGLLLPSLSGDELHPWFRTICPVFVALLIVVWAVVARWWPAGSHARFMLRGRLVGSVLAGVWFCCIQAVAVEFRLADEADLYPVTVALSQSGAMLIFVGSIPGLLRRSESA